VTNAALPHRPKTAFVLAGGGSLGAVQVGMLRALVEANVTPDFIVGSSVGAINAACFAGAPTREGVDRMEALWCNVRRSDIFPMSWRRIFGFLCRRDHLVPSDGLRRLIAANLPYRNLEDARLPVHVVATDVLTGSDVTFSSGSATEAILASSAIPAAFAPVEIGGRLLCDGAVASNTPVRAAVAAGATRLIVLPTGFACAPSRAPHGAIESALHAITLLTARQLVSELGRLEAPVVHHILPTSCPQGISPFDFTRARELIETAHSKTTRWIEEGGLAASTLPAALHPHRHAARARARAERRATRRTAIRLNEGLGRVFAAVE
jgi:NTE family protein